MLSKDLASILCENTATKDAPVLLDVSPPLPVHQPTREQSSIQKNRTIIPDKGDTLFWCVYMYHYGMDKYLAIGNKYGNAEIVEKQKIMEFLKANKHALKNVNRKITLSAAQEIMSDLMTNTKTSLQTLSALSVFYKKNILLLNQNNKTCMTFLFDKDQMPNGENEHANMEWLVIEYNENKKYGFFPYAVSDITTYTSTYICIEYADKPLRGISTYKMGELMDIAVKIPDLAKESKLPKPELYGKIWHYCLWI
jgi:hypothetical protein